MSTADICTDAAASAPLAAALAAAEGDLVAFDLDGIAARYTTLTSELPGVEVRFAMKACAEDPVLRRLAAHGCGVDAASPGEIRQALAVGVPADRMHYGNTVKSDRDIAEAHRRGIREFATDNAADLAALAAHAPGARVFARLASGGGGALWGLSDKFGCTPGEAVTLLAAAREAGLVPSGLSVHVGSQQMSPDAWRQALDDMDTTLAALARRGIHPDHVNLGGGLPALGYRDRDGRRLEPPLDKTFAVLREGMARLRRAHGDDLAFRMEPGRHLVADHGAIRAHVARLSRRLTRDGQERYWLYLSCGKFNGMYEMDALQYPLHFPTHPEGPYVPAVVAGPTCDSDDAYSHRRGLVRVPKALASGDPVWVLSSGAYATGYTTARFNGFAPPARVFVTGGDVAGGDARAGGVRPEDGRTEDGRTEDGRLGDGRTEDVRPDDGRPGTRALLGSGAA